MLNPTDAPFGDLAVAVCLTNDCYWQGLRHDGLCKTTGMQPEFAMHGGKVAEAAKCAYASSMGHVGAVQKDTGLCAGHAADAASVRAALARGDLEAK